MADVSSSVRDIERTIAFGDLGDVVGIDIGYDIGYDDIGDDSRHIVWIIRYCCAE